jgi:hypothetical protein
MNLQSLFASFEKAGIKTLGQAKSALVSAGVHPSGVFINHAELDKALQSLKPVAAGAAGAAASAAAATVAPAAAPIAGAMAPQAAELAANALIPHVEHLFEVMQDNLKKTLEQHFSPLHAALAAAPAAPAAAKPAG